MALGLIAKIRGERETVGIDVGHYSIKYVKVYHNSRGGKVVVDADIEPVPDGAIINGEIQRREGDAVTDEDGKKEKDGYEMLSESIAKLLLRHPIDDSVEVVASVNCGAGAGGVLVDHLSVKVPKNGNEAAIILQTAQSRPPFDDQDNVIDYEIYSRENEDVKVNVVAGQDDSVTAKNAIRAMIKNRKFYKGSGKARGSGIGLAVCEEIVTRHGGKLTIENVPDGGVLATVRLPVNG